VKKADVLDVLDRLDAAGIEWWIDGGCGVDVLFGAATRRHDDLDLIVRREDIGRLPTLFPEFVPADEEWWPARFVLRDSSGRQVDFHPVAFDERGEAGRSSRRDPRSLPAADLRGSGRIGPRAVRCITPELQLKHHDYATGSPDDIDWDDVRVLCESFGLGVPPGYSSRPGFIEAKRRRAGPRC
jgi:lincosamide nucleotidyltransferase A/C/D/E